MMQWLIIGGFVNAATPAFKSHRHRITRIVRLAVVIAGIVPLKLAITHFNVLNVSN
jgi:hypothetical protein